MLLKKFFTAALAPVLLLSLTPGASRAGENSPEDVTRLLYDYVNAGGDSFGFQPVRKEKFPGIGTAHMIHLTSQTWRGEDWEHWLVVLMPEEIKYEDSAVLIVEGGRNRPEPPSMDGRQMLVFGAVAGALGAPVAVLGQVPNQPLWGLREDALIAMTFEKFLAGGGPDWPLLLPMTKSAVRAMDALQEFFREEAGLEVEKFVVGGGSKRGWTSYLAAAADERVRGAVPAVIDLLNIPEQMRRQLMSYGEYSERISDYSDRGLMDRLVSEEGRKLARLVDPYSYRDKLVMPKLIILGTNDPYWTVDASGLYFDGLPPPKYLHYGPGAGHTLELESIPTLLGFLHSVFSGEPLPELDWSRGGDGSLTARWSVQPHAVKLHSAHAAGRDFRKARWEEEALSIEGESVTVKPRVPGEGYLAYFLDVIFAEDVPAGIPVRLSTEIVVLPDGFPYTEEGEPR